MKPCALLKLDFLTSAYKKCMRQSESLALVRRKGFIIPAPAYDTPIQCSIRGEWWRERFSRCSLLRQKSRGIPAWCEQLLQSMCQEGTLKLIPYKDEMPRELDRSATPTTQVYDPEGVSVPRDSQRPPRYPTRGTRLTPPQ